MTRNPATTSSRKAKYGTGGATKSNHVPTGRNGRATDDPDQGCEPDRALRGFRRTNGFYAATKRKAQADNDTDRSEEHLESRRDDREKIHTADRKSVV